MEYEQEFVDAFYSAAGQPVPQQLPFLHYSSSVSIEMVGKVLLAGGKRRIGLLAPTFDNIPLLLRRAGAELVAIQEDQVAATGSIPAPALKKCDAVFLVMPNNPSGWVPDPEVFARIIDQVAAAGCGFVVDCSFRFFSNLHTWDQYTLVSDSGVPEWIFVEDTGKTWSAAEMKVGLAACSPGLRETLEKVTNELLLNVSPFVLAFLASLINADARRAGMRSGRELFAAEAVRKNREILRSAFRESVIKPASPHSKISVDWLHLAQRSAISLSNSLAQHGVAVLPGGPFYWNNRRTGNGYIRVALAREPSYFAEAVHALSVELTRLGAF